MSRWLVACHDWLDSCKGRLYHHHRRITVNYVSDRQQRATYILVNTQLIEIHWFAPCRFVLDIVCPDIETSGLEMLIQSIHYSLYEVKSHSPFQIHGHNIPQSSCRTVPYGAAAWEHTLHHQEVLIAIAVDSVDSEHVQVAANQQDWRKNRWVRRGSTRTLTWRDRTCL